MHVKNLEIYIHKNIYTCFFVAQTVEQRQGHGFNFHEFSKSFLSLYIGNMLGRALEWDSGIIKGRSGWHLIRFIHQLSLNCVAY